MLPPPSFQTISSSLLSTTILATPPAAYLDQGSFHDPSPLRALTLSKTVFSVLLLAILLIPILISDIFGSHL